MICRGCNYPIPSWQHNGACKPVEDKVPPLARVPEMRTETVTNRTETPEQSVRKGGRPKRWATEAERLAAYRERKKQG